MEESRVVRRQLAEQVTEAIMNRHWAGVHAIGLLGSLAHGDDDEYSDVNLGVVTSAPGSEFLRSVVRRVNGIVVHLEVRSVESWLEQARTLTPEWPLVANRYLISKPVFDPHGWYPVLRQAHLDRLREASDLDFAKLARAALLSAVVFTGRARREFVRSGTDDTEYLLTQAALRTALVTGLLERTRYRNRREALRRVGLGRPTLDLLDERHAGLAAQLAERDAPIDAAVEGLVGSMGTAPAAELARDEPTEEVSAPSSKPAAPRSRR